MSSHGFTECLVEDVALDDAVLHCAERSVMDSAA